MLARWNWKSVAELIGVLALVLSLLFVGLQMKQTNDVAYMELNTTIVGITVDTAELVSTNAEVWVKGNAGEDLNDVEAAVFRQIITAINTRIIVEHMHANQLGQNDIADLIRRDWVAFLHQNPGARRVWLSRENKLIEYRQLLAPEESDFATWRNIIQSDLAKLDELTE